MDSKNKFEMTVEEVEALNSAFPIDEPLFIIDYENKQFKWAISRDDAVSRITEKLEKTEEVR